MLCPYMPRFTFHTTIKICNTAIGRKAGSWCSWVSQKLAREARRECRGQWLVPAV